MMEEVGDNQQSGYSQCMFPFIVRHEHNFGFFHLLSVELSKASKPVLDGRLVSSQREECYQSLWLWFMHVYDCINTIISVCG